MKGIRWTAVVLVFMFLAFWFGNSTYYKYIDWYFGAANLISSSSRFIMTAGLINGLSFILSTLIISFYLLRYQKHLSLNKFIGLELCLLIVNIILFSLCVGIHKALNAPSVDAGVTIDITGFYFYPELIISTLITLILFGIIYAKALSKNTQNGLRKSI